MFESLGVLVPVPLILSTVVMISPKAYIRALSSIGLPSFRLNFFRSAFRRFFDDRLQAEHDQINIKYYTSYQKCIIYHMSYNLQCGNHHNLNSNFSCVCVCLTRRCGSYSGSIWNQSSHYWLQSKAQHQDSLDHLHLMKKTEGLLKSLFFYYDFKCRT